MNNNNKHPNNDKNVDICQKPSYQRRLRAESNTVRVVVQDIGCGSEFSLKREKEKKKEQLLGEMRDNSTWRVLSTYTGMTC